MERSNFVQLLRDCTEDRRFLLLFFKQKVKAEDILVCWQLMVNEKKNETGENLYTSFDERLLMTRFFYKVFVQFRITSETHFVFFLS